MIDKPTPVAIPANGVEKEEITLEINTFKVVDTVSYKAIIAVPTPLKNLPEKSINKSDPNSNTEKMTDAIPPKNSVKISVKTDKNSPALALMFILLE